MTIREAIAQGSADLKFAGIKTPGLDASLLLSHVLKITRTALAASLTDLLSDETCEEFCSLLERRAGGECTAYLVGKKEFRGLEFTVSPSVLVPRPDTETLVETAVNSFSNNLCCSLRTSRPACALDICTGSGAVAISLKNEMPNLDVRAADISSGALEIAKANSAKLLSPENQVLFYQGDLYDALPDNLSFDMIVGNPPYIASGEIETLAAEVRNEPRIALDGGASGLEIIARVIEGAPARLKSGGLLLLEADPRQMDSITNMLEKKGFKDIELYKDLSGLNRVIGGRLEK